MSASDPTLAEIAEWGLAALCPDEDKRARAVRNLTFALYSRMEEVHNLQNKLERYTSPAITKVYGAFK